jgi:hypothetical protein
MCLGVNVIDLVLNENFRKLGCHWRRWLGVFIASNHFLAVGWVCCRWAHWTVRWCTIQGTVYCPVRATSAARWGLERLTVGTLCPVAAPDSPGCSDLQPNIWLCIIHFCSRPLSAGYRCSVGSPDMFGAHQTVRWIIAERALVKPESGQFEWSSAWGTGHCLVRHLEHTLKSLLQTLLSPQLNFFLGLCWTLCTCDKRHLGKLISPRGLWWTSTTKINYRKWLSPFPFQSLPFWWLMPTQTKANIKCRNVTSLQLWLMCIGYLDLDQLKDFIHMSKNKRDCFLLFNIFGPHLHHLLVFCKSFGKIFSKSFANSQRYRNMISRSIFKIWNSSPCFKCFSFD